MADGSDLKPVPRIPPGVVDGFASYVVARNWMVEVICGVYTKFGFAPLETPAVEYLDVLGKYLPESDEPEGGVFAFKDDDGQWLSLRYDLTAPLSRVVAQYGTELPSPYRSYQVGPVWRREKPGPGRFRQFYQCDFDTVGASSAAADAEVCAVIAAALEELGISRRDFQVRVNNRKVLSGILEGLGIAADEVRRVAVLRAVDKLDRLGLDGVRDLLGKGRRDASGDFTPGADLTVEQVGRVLEFVASGEDGASRADVCKRLRLLVGNSGVGQAGVEELEKINVLLDSMDLESDVVRFDPTVVRGLAYYTGPVFEAVLTCNLTDESGARRSFGAVAGGGRYDGLVRRFTGTEIPATGASVGVDRLLSALKALNKIECKVAEGPIVVTVMDRFRLFEYQRMVWELRAAGLAAELYLGDGNFRAQMKYADKRGAPAVVIAGDDEFGRNEVSIRDLRVGAGLAKDIKGRDEWRKSVVAQKRVARSALVGSIREILERRDIRPA